MSTGTSGPRWLEKSSIVTENQLTVLTSAMAVIKNDEIVGHLT